MTITGKMERVDVLGISTCWWHGRTDKGSVILAEALTLGLDGVELDYRLTPSMFEEMRPDLRRSCPALTVHNVFPLPVEIKRMEITADPFLLSSTDREEHSQAVKYAIRTIQHAHDVEARAVILHLGRVEMPDPTNRLKAFLKAGKIGQDEALAYLEEQCRIRREGQQANLDAVLFSLDRLNAEAEKREVLLGIENRLHFHEIPNLEEVGIILEQFRGGRLGYWHDVGHARVQEKLGIMAQRELLETHSKAMIGIHLHDVKGLEDHLAPGQGEVDFKELDSFLKPLHLKILELRPEVTREALLDGIELLTSLGMR